MSSSQSSWNRGWQDAWKNQPTVTKPTQTWQEKQAQQAGNNFGKSQQNQTDSNKK